MHFNKIFKKWKISEGDIESILLNLTEFKKVELRNYTLSWPNIVIEIPNEKGELQKHPFEIGPDILYKLSEESKHLSRHRLGRLIKNARLKAGLTQQQLAMRSGTTRFYISRLENDKTDVEMSTFRKIVEAGLGRNLKLLIE